MKTISCKRPEHLFVSLDGNLSDTRNPNWYLKPLRQNYSKTYRNINTISELKATLRNGSYTWPGGYPLYLLYSDNTYAHLDCIKNNWKHIIQDWKSGEVTIIACEINWENDFYCEICHKPIESAYGDDVE